MTPVEQLSDAVLRGTGPRVAVLTEVHAHPRADVETLTAKVRTRLGSVPSLGASNVNGFPVDESEVTYWGLRPTCQQNCPPPLSREPAYKEGES